MAKFQIEYDMMLNAKQEKRDEGTLKVARVFGRA